MASRAEQDRAAAAAATESASNDLATEVQRLQQEAEQRDSANAARFERAEAKLLQQQEHVMNVTGGIEQKLTEELNAQAGLLDEHSKQWWVRPYPDTYSSQRSFGGNRSSQTPR